MGTNTASAMTIQHFDEAPSFIERMQNDQQKRAEKGQINELKREAQQAPKREARRITKMVTNYEKQAGITQRGARNKEEEPPKPSEPKVVSHGKNKIREKDKYLDQWGPLGW